MNRRHFLRGPMLVPAVVPALAVAGHAYAAEGDGTPLQFMPKTAPDPDPLTGELERYKACPYCGMNRAKWHHSRHLVHYADDLVDGTCSLHCLAISLSLNLDRGPKAIYAADFGAEGTPRPLANVDGMIYLVGTSLPPTMSRVSKMAFAAPDRARTIQSELGGELLPFDQALRLAYTGMADDTAMIRKKRAERRARMGK